MTTAVDVSSPTPSRSRQAGGSAIVNDDEPPMPYTSLTDDDLRAHSMVELYSRYCSILKIRPNKVVLAQLPASPGQYYRCMVLDLNNTYLGSKGVVALLPFIERCTRLTDLRLAGVGMKVGAAKSLLTVVGAHPGILSLDVSLNDLGTEVGRQLLNVVRTHRRLHEVRFESTLLIDPIRRKIDTQLAKNVEMKSTFTIPLIPEDSDDVEMVKRRERDAEEAARVLREAQKKFELQERLPVWAPAALMDLSECLYKHREHMEDVYAIFDRGVREPTLEPKHFQRGMRILGISSLAGEVNRCTEFCDLFAAWDRSLDVVNYKTVVDTLRQHPAFSCTPTTSSSSSTTDGAESESAKRLRRHVVDRIFDARGAIRQAFEVLDVDQTGLVGIEEAVIGLISLVGTSTEQSDTQLRSNSTSDTTSMVCQLISEFVATENTAEASEEEEEKANNNGTLQYMNFLNCFQVDTNAVPRTDWIILRSELLAMV